MDRKVICVIHLPPLPGAPLHRGEEIDQLIEKAVRDARAIEEGKADGVIIENYGDKPFKVRVGQETVACMSVIAREVRRETSLSLGINVLRNDGFSAAAIARAVKADFIRVNQLFYPSVSPEGILEPVAAELMRYMKLIGCNARVFADVSVKHAIHAASLEDYAENFERSCADAAIVTGAATGRSVKLEELEFFRRKLECEIYAGSGVTPELALKIAEKDLADGIIVGTYIKSDSGTGIDSRKVRRIVESFEK